MDYLIRHNIKFYIIRSFLFKMVSDISDTQPIKKEEYEKFIAILKAGIPIESWKNLAEVVGVDQDTITEWKRTERAVKIINQTIKDSIEKMKKVGDKDWRMWREYIKLIGIDAAEQVQINAKVDTTNNFKNMTNEELDRYLETVRAAIISGQGKS